MWLVVFIQILASKFAGAAHCFCSAADAFLGRFLEMAAHFHLTENALTLHLLLQCAQRLIDVIIANNYFYHEIYPLPVTGQSNTRLPSRGAVYTANRKHCRGEFWATAQEKRAKISVAKPVKLAQKLTCIIEKTAILFIGINPFIYEKKHGKNGRHCSGTA
jgi:hypothetical protein